MSFIDDCNNQCLPYEDNFIKKYRYREDGQNEMKKIEFLNNKGLTGIPKVIDSYIDESSSSSDLSEEESSDQEFSNFNLILEKIEGTDLFTLAGHLPEDKFRSLFKKFVEILVNVHHLDVIHLDLKLMNLMTSTDLTEVYLVDWEFSIDGVETSIEIKEPRGTLEYICPEILTNNLAGKKADVYSLAISMMTLYLGENIFTGEEEEIQNQIVDGISKEWFFNNFPVDLASLFYQMTLVDHRVRINIDQVSAVTKKW